MPSQLSLAVVGAEYPNKRGPTRRFEIKLCRPGEPVELRREPKNPADSRAIGVYSCRGVQIGYVSAERASLVGQWIKRGQVRAIFQREDTFGAVIRISTDGSAPELPVEKSRKAKPASEYEVGQWEPDVERFE